MGVDFPTQVLVFPQGCYFSNTLVRFITPFVVLMINIIR